MSKKQQQLEKELLEILNDFEAVIDSQPDEPTQEQQQAKKEPQTQPETQIEPAPEQTKGDLNDFLKDFQKQEQQQAKKEPQTQPETQIEPAPEQKTEPEAKQNELFTETDEEKEERRGRKKLPRDKDGKIIRPEKKPEAPKSDLNDFLKDFQKQEEQPAAPATAGAAAPATAGAAAPAKMQMDVSKFINGAIFLMIMDAVFPMAFTWILSFINPKYKNIKPEARQKLKLTKEEKEMLEEGANEVVKYLFSESDPLTIFAVSMCFVYYSKFDSLTKEDFI